MSNPSSQSTSSGILTKTQPPWPHQQPGHYNNQQPGAYKGSSMNMNNSPPLLAQGAPMPVFHQQPPQQGAQQQIIHPHTQILSQQQQTITQQQIEMMNGPQQQQNSVPSTLQELLRSNDDTGMNNQPMSNNNQTVFIQPHGQPVHMGSMGPGQVPNRFQPPLQQGQPPRPPMTGMQPVRYISGPPPGGGYNPNQMMTPGRPPQPNQVNFNAPPVMRQQNPMSAGKSQIAVGMQNNAPPGQPPQHYVLAAPVRIQRPPYEMNGPSPGVVINQMQPGMSGGYSQQNMGGMGSMNDSQSQNVGGMMAPQQHMGQAPPQQGSVQTVVPIPPGSTLHVSTTTTFNVIPPAPGSGASSGSMQVTVVPPSQQQAINFHSTNQSLQQQQQAQQQQQQQQSLPPPPTDDALDPSGPNALGGQVAGTSSSASGGQSSGNVPPEKRKLIQHQLILLLHAHKCQQREIQAAQGQGSQPGGGSQQPPRQCELPHCQTMKQVLAHMRTCQDVSNCKFQHCTSSRRIIDHWRNCKKVDCPVCKDLRRDQSGRSSANVPGQPSIPDINIPVSPGPPGPVNVVVGDQPPILGPAPTSVVSNAGSGIINPLPPETTHAWHADHNEEVRRYLIDKTVKELSQLCAGQNNMERLYNFAKKTECEIFSKAVTREQYYMLLAEKIYKTRKQVEEKLRNQPPNSSSSTSQLPPSSSNEIKTEFFVPPGILPSSQPEPSPSGAMASRDPFGANIPSTPISSVTPTPLPGAGTGEISKKREAFSKALESAQQQITSQQQQTSSSTSVLNNSSSPNTSSLLTPVATTGQADTSIKEEPTTVVKPEPTVVEAIKAEPMETTAKQEIENTPAHTNGPKPTSSAAAPAPTTTPAAPAPTPAAPKFPLQKKTFRPDELRQYLLPSLEKLFRQPESEAFRQPVDPIALGIPDYFDVVKQPMDLSTIKSKLDTGRYADPWEFCDDVWLMFENAWLYNKRTSRVYRHCSKLAEVFEGDIDPVMQSLGYCCGRKHAFVPQALCCQGKPLCAIQRDAIYYHFEMKYLFCDKCFSEQKCEEVEVLDEQTQETRRINKSLFKQDKNNHIEYEPTIDCIRCGRRFHRICALYIGPGATTGDCDDFECENCMRARNAPKREFKYTSKKLPQNRLSKHIEDRVNQFLREQKSQHAPITLRVLSSTEKYVEVKSGMRTRYPDALPPQIKYRSKAMFAFQEINGVEVMFFGMHVQEYDHDAPPCNARRVYISYLDSVKFFQPHQLRTDVYHKILIAYLEYVRELGYVWGHIWACPPGEGDDYIFHCHPPDQKIPKPKRLQEWYKRMLDKSVQERVILEYRDIFHWCNEKQVKNPYEISYFEGDYWPNILEETVRELETEERKRQEEQEKLQALAGSDSDGDDDSQEALQGPKVKKTKIVKSKSKKKAMGASRKPARRCGFSSGSFEAELWKRTYELMERIKDMFFVIKMQPDSVMNNLPPIVDPDSATQQCDLMDGRDTFLSTCREKHYEFFSLRRAKYSTMATLFDLFTSGGEGLQSLTCNACSRQIASDQGYHCNSCADYDLCMACYEKERHPHEMLRIADAAAQAQGNAANGAAGASQSADDRLAANRRREQHLQAFVQRLEHAVSCLNANCTRECMQMKHCVAHVRNCRLRQQPPNATCRPCTQLICIAIHHARHCVKMRCQVPFCLHMRYKWRQQESATVQRRMAIMRSGMMTNGGAPPGGPDNQQQPGSIPPPSTSTPPAPPIVAPGSNQMPPQQQPPPPSFQQQQQQQSGKGAPSVQQAPPTPQAMTPLPFRPDSVQSVAPSPVPQSVQLVQQQQQQGPPPNQTPFSSSQPQMMQVPQQQQQQQPPQQVTMMMGGGGGGQMVPQRPVQMQQHQPLEVANQVRIYAEQQQRQPPQMMTHQQQQQGPPQPFQRGLSDPLTPNMGSSGVSSPPTLTSPLSSLGQAQFERMQGQPQGPGNIVVRPMGGQPMMMQAQQPRPQMVMGGGQNPQQMMMVGPEMKREQQMYHQGGPMRVGPGGMPMSMQPGADQQQMMMHSQQMAMQAQQQTRPMYVAQNPMGGQVVMRPGGPPMGQMVHPGQQQMQAPRFASPGGSMPQQYQQGPPQQQMRQPGPGMYPGPQQQQQQPGPPQQNSLRSPPGPGLGQVQSPPPGMMHHPGMQPQDFHMQNDPNNPSGQGQFGQMPPPR